jgi:hypothetical protein
MEKLEDRLTDRAGVSGRPALGASKGPPTLETSLVRLEGVMRPEA